jgi:hypothetical protein
LEFRLRTYYVRPTCQLRQLELAGFSSVELYGLAGEHIDPIDADAASDPWIYYLARPDPQNL